tara:strand:- start:931 stop:1674 length:744 start_codon:yes stop_codon:yes gene_type:complete
MKLTATYPFIYLIVVIAVSIKLLPKNHHISINSKIPSHQLWNEVLEKHVSNKGVVNYKEIAKSKKFEKYLSQLASSNPYGAKWSKEDRLCFWINVYNAFTIKLIINNPGIKSIKEIDEPWSNKFIEINEESISLGEIEHEILRKQNEPMIHFAIVCASLSCPVLLNRAYEPDSLKEQLVAQAKCFINDPKRNNLTSKELSLSKIFKWFRIDFTKRNNLIHFINKYSKVEINTNAEISFRDYDWKLNN